MSKDSAHDSRRPARAAAAGDWRVVLEARADVPPDERIERTVYVRAPRSTRYGEVAKVIDAVKGAGAQPVSLQTDALPN
ncbi:MAG: biopolymer transporter ExbD [Acidobacteria bacterium]|nr:biopolymer transporter ExbD [Acidobacteriota bacterium]